LVRLSAVSLRTSFAWNAIFLINVPIGVVAALLALLVLPGRKAEPEHQAGRAGRNRFDILGLLLSMVGFSVLVYGLTSAGSRGWGNATVLALIVGRDPAVRAYQEARARGEEMRPERLPVMSE
jgi:MFS family permease